MILHLEGGPRDGDTIDLDDDRWGHDSDDLDAGILPARITLNPLREFADQAGCYDLVRADTAEGWYRLNVERTAQLRRCLTGTCARPHQHREGRL